MSKLKENMEFLSLDIKKEILKIVGINVGLIALMVCSYIFLDQIYVFIFICVAAVVVDYILLTSYSSRKERVLKERENEFVSIISYFEIFISNNTNVYHAFECLIPYSSTWMANEITNLLHEIDYDKSVKPFINFAHLFNSTSIENIMLSIYQMIDEGESNTRLNQFVLTFEEFSRTHKLDLLDSKQKSLDSINNFPLIGAGLIAIVLTFSVISVIGELINVV